ncbi:YqaA family protein [Salinisphaera orenii]|uniref:Alkaline phosphatase n=1 Tax=Salinisphaera orenii YIM 95161 TaxID=1051139 RepID=A0A423Q5P5_9GAMM|nr:VTT domain-containing protein [Salinisphaera halophila]ROO34889.1 alkaline phosphatase [Salinisphaera halophila YIM 95161]
MVTRASRWTQRLLDSNHGLAWLGVLSAMETLILPVPIELVMVPYMLARPARLWLIAAVTLGGCVAGSLIGYGIGFFVFDSIGQWLLDTLGADAAYERFSQRFSNNGFLAIVAIGVTPIPFQVALLAAGIAGYALPLFLVAVGLARGLRYFGLALLVYLVGERALALWRRHALLLGTSLLLLIAGVVVGMRVLGGP